MKTLKKYFKVILCFMAFAVCSFLFAVSPTISAVSAMNYTVEQYNVVINSIKMPTTKLDLSKNPTQKFIIPLIKDNIGSDANDYSKQVIRVIDPAGKEHDYVVGGDNANTIKDADTDAQKATKYFSEVKEGSNVTHIQVESIVSGQYKIVYIVTDNNATESLRKTYYSNAYYVDVVNVAYELDFTQANGLKTLFKPEVAKGSEKIEIPAAKVKVIGGAEVKTLSPATYVRVTKNGKVQPLNGTFSDGSKSAFISEGTGDNTKYYINPTASGNYTIEYTYSEGVNRPTATFKVKVTDDFVASSVLKVNDVTLPSMELGQTGITLPKLVVNRGEGQTSNVETDIEHNVTKIVIEKENNSNIKCTLENNTYEFDFVLGTGNGKFSGATKYEDLVGVYKVTYYVEDAYGNEITYSKITSSSVTISSKPTVYMSYNYDITTEENVKVADNGVNSFKVKEGEKVATDASTSLKETYGYAELYLPAIYGTDTITKTEDLMFVRILRNASSNKAYYIDNLKYENSKLTAVKYGEQGYNYALNGITYADEDDKVGTLQNTTDSKIGNPNTASKFRFTKDGDDADYAGTYYLEYLVYSNNVKSGRYGSLLSSDNKTKYSITITKDAVAENGEKPKVDIENLTNSSVRPEDSITVKVKSTDESNKDTRLKNAAFFYTSTTSAKTLEEDVQKAVEEVANSNENKRNVLDDEAFVSEMTKLGYVNFNIIEESATKDTFVLESLTSKFTNDQLKVITNVYVVAVSLNNNGATGVDTVTLSVKNTINDDTAPVVVIDKTKVSDLISGTNVVMGEFDQVAEVKLPKVKYTDTDSHLYMSVMYYVINKDADGKIIKSPETKYGLDYKTPAGVQYGSNLIDGGTITTSEVGTYYVVYTATDAAGNTSVTYFTFDVVDSSKPVLSVNVVNPYDKEGVTQSGNTVTAEVGSVLDFETTLRSGDGNNTDYTSPENITITIDNGEGLAYSPSGRDGYSYIFNSVGTYTITIGGEYNTRKADNKIYKVVITEQKLEWAQEFDIPQYAAKGEEVYLPYMTTNHDAVVEVKVTTPTGATPTEGEAETAIVNGVQVWKFKTNSSSKGLYKVVYKATSKYTSIEKSFTIKVGDNIEPTITMSHKEDLKQEIVFDSEIEYKIDIDRNDKTVVITASKNGSEIYSYDLGLKIKDIDEEGYTTDNTYSLWDNLSAELTGKNVTSKGDGVYTITGAGKCTLTIKASDGELANVRTETFEFNVVTETEPEEKDNTVVGTVLIVISLVVLAGVILFFALTGKKGNGKKVKSAKKEEKAVEVEEQEDEETEEVVEETAEEVEESNEDNSDDAKTGEVE